MKEVALFLKGLPLRLVFSIAFVIVSVLIAVIAPFDDLDSTGHIMLGTMISALAMWIFQPGSGTFSIGVAIIFIGGAFAGISMGTLASGFTSPSLWLIIPAMFIGFALMKTGFGKRLVLAVFRHMNLTYAKVLVGFLPINIFFSLITPSIAVRILLMTPVAVSVADACRLEKGCRGRSLIVISCWALSIYPSIAWINGSLFGPAFTAFLPQGMMRDLVTPEIWFRVMAPWLLFAVVFVVVLYFLLKPEKELSITKSQLSEMYEELGPPGKEEKGCIATLVFLIVALIAQNFLPFSTNQALLAALVLLLILGVLSRKDISTGANWDVIMFMGAIMSFPQIFEVSGLTAWLSPFLSSLLSPIAWNPLVFVLGLFGLCVLLRFVDVAQGWITAAILGLATPFLLSDHGIHPMIMIMVFVSASNVFFFRYAQPWIVQVESVCGDGGWNPRHLKSASVLYVVLAAAMLVFCRFYWELIGVL